MAEDGGHNVMESRRKAIRSYIEAASRLLSAGDDAPSPFDAMFHYSRAIEIGRVALVMWHFPDGLDPAAIIEIRPLGDIGIMAELNERLGKMEFVPGVHDPRVFYTIDDAQQTRVWGYDLVTDLLGLFSGQDYERRRTARPSPSVLQTIDEKEMDWSKWASTSTPSSL